MAVSITTINTSLGNPNSGTGDTIYAAFNKVNDNTSNLATIVDNINATYANTTFGKFANITVTNQVVGRLDIYTSTGGLYVDGSPVATAAASFTGGNVPNQANFRATTSSISANTGAVVITGGLGVGGNIYANGTTYSNSVVITSGLYWSGNGVAYTTAYNSSGAGNITVSGTNLSLTPTGPGSASVGSSTAIPVFTTDAYGRVVYSTTAAVIAPAGTLTGSTLAAGVTASSLTSVGTLTGLSLGGTLTINNATSPNTNTIQFGDNSGWTLRYMTSVGGTPTQRFSFTDQGAFSATGTITAATVNAATIGNAGAVHTGSSFTASGTVIAATVNAATIGNTGAALTGTLQTAAQTNITSLGTLSGLTVSGAIIPSSNNAIDLGGASNYWATVYGTSFVGTSTTAKYADLAEKYLTDQDYSVGTVVAVGGASEVTACSLGDRAIGVVSANPAYMMNAGLEGGTYIALKGRVPVSVTGTVRKGQRLIAGDAGCAVAGDAQSNNVFAIALETNTDSGVRLIEAVIL